MNKLNFDYVPLTFISDKQEIKKQIKNTLILIHLFEKYNKPVRLENLIEGTQYGYNASALQSGKNKFLRISDIHESKVTWESVPYCNCDDEETYLLKNEDILIARTGGTTGKSFKIDSPPKHSIYAGYLIRIRAKKEVNSDYIYLFLHSFAYWSQIVNLNERNFRPKANAENLKSLILPDCERTIQDEVVRISQGENIKGYEDLFSKIEKALLEYEKTQEIDSILIDQLTQIGNLNQAILQEAVQGKLVEQNPADEPATELLKRIKAAKEKTGKKDKPLPPIKPEEIPFKIPESWVWCRLGEITDFISGNNFESSDFYKGEGVKCIKITNAGVREIIETDDVLPSSFREQYKQFLVYEGDLVLALTRPYISTGLKISVCPLSYNESLLNQRVAVIRSFKGIASEYVYQFLSSNIVLKKYQSMFEGQGQQPNLKKEDVTNLLFPLPPLSEQKRIVAEIEKQLAKTKQLKEHIIANQQATEQLLKALLHQAFEVEEREAVE